MAPHPPPPPQPNHFDELSITYHSRSELFAISGDYDKALFDINLSIKLLPNIDKYLRKNQILRALKKFREAKRLVTQLIEMSIRGDIDLKYMTIERLEDLNLFNDNDLQTYGDYDDTRAEICSIQSYYDF